MYSNYFIINDDFLDGFEDIEKVKLSEYAYSIYCKCCKRGTKRLAIAKYLSSPHTRYPVVYFYCPKCKKSYFLPCFGKKAAENMKYCANCREPSIDHRFNEGIHKVADLLKISDKLEDSEGVQSKELNQCIITMLCSIYEVYLRDFYADILNSKFVRQKYSLYKKFLKDCKNDFLNPGKTADRFKKELGIDYRNIIGEDVYKALILLADSRNVIVHNNGICDTAFVSHHPDIEIRSQIMPSTKMVLEFFKLVILTVKQLDEIYQKEIRSIVILNMTEQIKVSGLPTQAKS